MDIDYSVTKIIKMVGDKKKVLEFGCATGYMSQVLKEEYRCEVTGIEIDNEAAKEAEKYCSRIIVGNIEKIDYKSILGNEQFDTMIFADVLEHLRDPRKVLQSIQPFLKNDGYILASIPNIAFISVVLDLLEGKFDYRDLGLLDETHLRFFTKKSIFKAFRDAGYEIVLWDRMIVDPQDSEFKTRLETFPKSLISYLGTGNELMTYQFIIKAVKQVKADKNEIEKEEKNFTEELKEQVKSNMELLAMKDKALAAKDKELLEKEIESAEKTQIIDEIKGSHSWRLTSPLRKWRRVISKRNK